MKKTVLCIGLTFLLGQFTHSFAEVNPGCEYQTGPCVMECPYTYFKPVYYYTSRCVQEPYLVNRKCIRYVPRYFDVPRCRYVAQYYCEKQCRYEPECYCIQETKYRPRQISDLQCRYIPCTYVKRTCQPCPQPCPCPPPCPSPCPCPQSCPPPCPQPCPSPCPCPQSCSFPQPCSTCPSNACVAPCGNPMASIAPLGSVPNSYASWTGYLPSDPNNYNNIAWDRYQTCGGDGWNAYVPPTWNDQ